MKDTTPYRPVSAVSADPADPADPARGLCRLWEDGGRPELDDYLGRCGPLNVEQLVEVLHVDQRERWHAGERVPAEAYLARYPAVAANVEMALDLIYGEFRFREDRGEEPRADEYLRRFPRYRTQLEGQFEFYRALAARQSSDPQRHQPTPPDAADGWPSRRPADRPGVALLAGSGPHATGELRDLLQSRLRFLTLLLSGGIAPAVVFALTEYWRSGNYLPPGDEPQIASAAALMALAAALAGILWRCPSLSLPRLRAIELTVFASTFAFWSWIDATFYPGLRLSQPPVWFGAVMATAISAPWVLMITVYGIFIPNTWRRCAAVVSVMALAPVVISTATGLSADSTRGHTPGTYLLFVTLYPGVAAAIATYGAHRIEAQRQEILATRRLGQYQLKQRLGAGGMGEVYLAEHLLLRRPCAVKLIRPERAGDRTRLARFEREVQVTATLTHPNTVEVFDYGHTEDGTFYYVMEYLPGLSLDQLVSRHGPQPPERVAHLLSQVCGALQEAHAVGLIHRDVKPGNILVCERGGSHDVAKLLDFGLVQAGGPGRGGQKLTQEGAIAGTPAFMSPEQAAGKTDLDGRSDIYSLGAVAYFLLTGRPPFVRQTAVQTLAAHIDEPPAAPSREADVPADLEAVVLRCLEKDAAARFPDAESLERALAACGCAGRWTRERAAEWWLHVSKK
jgi:serine/threonine-protein kinase